MKKLLKQTLVSKDAQIAKSGCPCKDNKEGGAPTGQTLSGWLAQVNKAKQQIDSEAERELGSLSELACDAGQGKGGQ